jgi:hypothetical protein
MKADAGTSACVVICPPRNANNFCKTRQGIQQDTPGTASDIPSLPFFPVDVVRGALAKA